MTQIVSAERVAALRNKRLNLSSTSERTLQSRTVDVACWHETYIDPVIGGCPASRGKA
jgi:hypothetical protein